MCQSYRSISLVSLKLHLDLPPQHVTLLCLLQDKYELVDTVDFIFNVLDQRTKGIGNVVDESI